jgi:hypothetical protein
LPIGHQQPHCDDMDQILAVRSKIYDQFHGSNAGPEHFFKDEYAEAFAAYYTPMYLIQDTGESVAAHLECGFSSDPLSTYIEFWGVMQAIFIQDAICELHKAVVGSQPHIQSGSNLVRNSEDQKLMCRSPRQT